MAIDFNELLNELRLIAPRELEEEWDNGGLQINMGNKEVNKVLITLEITEEVIKEAVKLNVDFIVTHHPLLFKKIDVVDATSVVGNYIIKLIQYGITVYSAHTAFDSVFGGNNDYLADMIGLQKVRRLKKWTPTGDKELIGRVGTFAEPASLKEIANNLQSVLKLKEHVKIVGNPDKLIETAAICTGAGGDAIEAVIRSGCDLFITGDVRHHEAQMAREMGLCLIDAGHYGTEYFFVENFANKLRKATEDKLEVLESNVIVNPFDSMVYYFSE